MVDDFGLVKFVFVVGFVIAMVFNMAYQQDLEWRRQDAVTSWNFCEKEKIGLQNQINELQNQINELQNQINESQNQVCSLNKELAVCEIILTLEKENSSK